MIGGQAGDGDSDGVADLYDVILILKLLGGNADVTVNLPADVNGYGKIGMADVRFILMCPTDNF